MITWAFSWWSDVKDLVKMGSWCFFRWLLVSCVATLMFVWANPWFFELSLTAGIWIETNQESQKSPKCGPQLWYELSIFLGDKKSPGFRDDFFFVAFYWSGRLKWWLTILDNLGSLVELHTYQLPVMLFHTATRCHQFYTSLVAVEAVDLPIYWIVLGLTLLMAEILHRLRLVVYPIIYRVLYIPGGDRWISEPSTVLNCSIVRSIHTIHIPESHGLQIQAWRKQVVGEPVQKGWLEMRLGKGKVREVKMLLRNCSVYNVVCIIFVNTPGSLTARPWKMMVGWWSFPFGARLMFRGYRC